MEAIDEGIVATSIEVQCAHDAGHAQHVRTHGEAFATAVANQRKVFRRENAGRSRQIAFHQCIHSDIGGRPVVVPDE